jgi:class 3 adenylate cyclase/DNA-binding winged helix-turn-helix (wHTH) protein/predicted ATPase
MRYVFGDYALDTDCYELRRAGMRLPLGPKAFEVLTYLLQHRGRAVTKVEILERLWPNQFVSESVLTSCILVVRKAIGDRGSVQQCIKTVRGRGYRFIAPVQEWRGEGSEVEAQAAQDRLGHAEEPTSGHTEADPHPALAPPEQPSALPSVPVPTNRFPTVGPGTPAAERRQLTVLSCRVSSALPRADPLDPEVLLEVVPDYQALCAELVHQFAGYVAQDQGDRLVVYFGYPRAHDDDARRAVHTGLAMVERMAELNTRLKRDAGVRLAVRVGIHTGVAVIGAMGQDERTQLALGDTPTIAAQVQGLATPDTVVISQTTRRLVEGYFDAQVLGSHLLDALPEPLTVYQVVQESTYQSLFEVEVMSRATPLVGREHEVGLLHERWTRAKDGLGQVVLLSGEAGMGKSRLVHALRAHIAGEAHTRIDCRCSPYYQNTALYPLVTHLQRLLQFTRQDTSEEMLDKLEKALVSYGFPLVELVPVMSVLLSLPPPTRYPPLTLTPQRQKQKTFEALMAWLLAEAERQPVCFVVEDLHWADASTLEWLDLLLDQVSGTRLLVLLLFHADFRPPWAMRSHLTHLTLNRLTRRQVEVMAEQVAGGKALPPEVLEQLVAKTDGVPLFVEELTKMVLELGLVKEWGESYELVDTLPPLAIPTTLHDSLMARLDRLEASKQMAQLGAVVGREFTYELIRAVSPMDEATLQQALSRLVEAELLYQRGLPPQARYIFKHALIQQEAYQSLLRRTRQQYHGQIAQVFEERFPQISDTQPELMAHHYTQAGRPAQASPYWQRAGQQALQRSANPEAVQHLTTALKLLATLPETPTRAQQELDLLITLGPALIATKGQGAPEVEQTYARARELCQQVGDTPQIFPTLRGLWRFYQGRGLLLTARELGEQLVRLAEREAALMPCLEAHNALGQSLFQLGDYTTAQAHLEQGIAVIDRTVYCTQPLYQGEASGVRCLVTAARTLWCLGYSTQAVRRSEEAVALAQDLAHPYSLAVVQYQAALLHHHRHDLPAVQAQAEALLTLATEQGFPLFVGHGTYLRGWVLAMQGDGTVGLAQIRQGLAAIVAAGQELSRPVCLVLLAEAMEHVGQTEDGLRLLNETLTVLEASGRGDLLAEAYRLQGTLLLHRAVPDAVQAEACFQKALAIARQQQAKSWELRAAMSLSRLWQQQDKHIKARALLAPIYGWFTEGFDSVDLQEAKALLEAVGEATPCQSVRKRRAKGFRQ